MTFSVFQLAMLGSAGVEYCSAGESLTAHKYQEDVDWTKAMAITQLVSVPFFMIWRYFAHFPSFKGNGMDSVKRNIDKSDPSNKEDDSLVDEEAVIISAHRS